MKNLLFLLFILTCMSIFSQEGFSIKGGVSLSHPIYKFDGDKADKADDEKLLPFMHLGGFYAIKVSDILYLEPGLMYNCLGRKFKIEASGNNSKTLFRIHYLQVPINIGINFELNKDDVSLFSYIGPYFGVAITGKQTIRTNINGDKNKSTNKMDFGKDAFSRFDAGLNFGVGVNYKKISLGLQYGVGLINTIGKDIRNSYGETVKRKNRCLAISVGYRFGDK